MANPWFRLYSEFSHDPKVQMMSEAMQRRYIMLMCLQCSNALVTLHDAEVAFHLRISDEDLAQTKALFCSKGFINEAWNLLNWHKRQSVSDNSKGRVAKHRALLKQELNALGNGDVTLQPRYSNAPEQNRTEQNRVEVNNKEVGDAVAPASPDATLHLEPDPPPKPEAKPPSIKKSRARSPVNPAFEPNDHGLLLARNKGLNVGSESTRFIDFHAAKGSLMADWQAAWRTWVGNAHGANAPLKNHEPAWRTEQRNRTLQAVPNIAARSEINPNFIDTESKNVTALALG